MTTWQQQSDYANWARREQGISQSVGVNVNGSSGWPTSTAWPSTGDQDWFAESLETRLGPTQ